MPDEKPANDDGGKNRLGREEQAAQTDGVGTKERDGIVDGRLDPDAQSPDKESTKPFDPNENDPA
ncbi:MAG: hypothetical protein PGN34_00570 [Methylobacterium frigidaeris]